MQPILAESAVHLLYIDTFRSVLFKKQLFFPLVQMGVRRISHFKDVTDADGVTVKHPQGYTLILGIHMRSGPCANSRHL